MKSFKLYLSLLLIMAVGAVSCSDNFDTPPVTWPTATIEANTTIADFKAKYWQNGTNYIDTIKAVEGEETPIIHGFVVSSDETGNIYKSLVIQDETAAISISINQSGLYSTYRVGQEVVIDLANMYVGKYAGLEQLGYPQQRTDGSWQASFMPLEFFQLHAQINGLPKPEDIDTITVGITSLPTLPAEICKMQSQLVRLDGVQWVDAGKPYSEETASTSRKLKDASGNTIDVRNSNYATFRSELLPEGTGSVVGILSYFNTSWQILLRSTDDVIGFGPEEGTKNTPYDVAKAIELQDKNVTGWVKGYIVGAVAAGVNEVSSSNDIEWKAPTTLANTIVIAPAADTKDISKCIIVPLEQGSALRTAANLLDNPTVYQKEISINGALKAYMGKAGSVSAGTASDFVLDGQGGGGETGDGDGSETKPFSTSQIIAGTASGTGVWVKGYIVGWVDGMTLASGATFTVPATSTSNVLIAATAGETNVSNCIPVQLPTGEVRSAINLKDNPTNLGKAVSLKGNIEAYFGATGLKTVTAYKLDGYVPPVTEDVDPVTTLSVNFTGITAISGLPGWKSVTVTGDKSWYFTSFEENTYAAMTGFKGTTPPFDAWLISQPLNVKDAAQKILSFQTNVNGYGSTTTVFEVYAMSSNDPATATKTKLNPTLATAPASGYAGMTPSGDISLAGKGDVVYIGFRFHATQDANYATWCVDDVTFK